jgi:hypothetical protein
MINTRTTNDNRSLVRCLSAVAIHSPNPMAELIKYRDTPQTG